MRHFSIKNSVLRTTISCVSYHFMVKFCQKPEPALALRSTKRPVNGEDKLAKHVIIIV